MLLARCARGRILVGICFCRGVLNLCNLQSLALLPLRPFNSLFFLAVLSLQGKLLSVCDSSLAEALKIGLVSKT